MLGLLRTATFRSSVRSFSTTPPRPSDLAKLILIGNLARDPEVRKTKNDRDFVTYTVLTQNYPPPPPDANGERRPSASTPHRIFSFQETSNKYLQTLRKGSKVYVEAGYELREPETGTDPSTPQGQRQIFLRHETIRVLNRPKITEASEVSEGEGHTTVFE